MTATQATAPHTSASTTGGALPLVLTMGEPAGIGPDITLDAYLQRRALGLPAFYIRADAVMLRRRAEQLGLDVPIAEATPSEAVALFDEALPVVDVGTAVAGVPGTATPSDAPAVIRSIEQAVDDVRAGRAAAVVTNPINKHALYGTGFAFPGHTEFLAELARAWGAGPGPDGVWTPVMLLAGPELSTVPVTVHIALSEVPKRLTGDAIVAIGRITARDLKSRFGIAAPRLAVAGLNPHAGENGAMGIEDDAIVAPAIAALRAEGIDAFGPLPSDTMFHARARAAYDVALCMYHDQALIPVKTIGFDETVNVTLGLPFVRTSPDHGTAYDIAGKGIARADSLVAALRLAARLAATAQAPTSRAGAA